MSKKITLLNQVTGPLFIDIANEYVANVSVLLFIWFVVVLFQVYNILYACGIDIPCSTFEIVFMIFLQDNQKMVQNRSIRTMFYKLKQSMSAGAFTENI